MNSDTAIDDINTKHTFFLDIEQAYVQAEKRNIIIDNEGNEQLQHCYYDGPLTDITLENFIKIEQNNFVEFFSDNKLPVPTLVIYPAGNSTDLELDSPDIIEDIIKYRKNLKIENYIHKDSYFVDRLEALNTAKQKNRINCGHPTIDGLQICFYNGDIIETQIENLVPVPFSELINFFTDTRLRIPSEIITPDALDNDIKDDVQNSFNNAIATVKKKQQELAQQLYLQAKHLTPDFNETELRVFLPSNRLTQVMQYSSKNIARAFEKQGYEVLLHIEANEMESLNSVEFFKEYINFRPHIVFQINHISNYYLHNDMINFIWFQDPMSEIRKKEKIEIRNNDFIFSAYKDFDYLLEECGITRYARQGMCADNQIFYKRHSIRKDKIVFVGSSYQNRLDSLDSTKEIVSILSNKFNQGEAINYHFTKQLAEEYKVDIFKVWNSLFSYVVRDTSVKWLCQLPDIDVEIYGYYWDTDTDVREKYCGSLEHGHDLAKIYNEAKYALVSLPYEVNSQRLAEISACGCIPIVWDCRYHAEPPHWDEHCLFFKTQEELAALIGQSPEKEPFQISETYSFDNFVHKMDNIIENQKSLILNEE